MNNLYYEHYRFSNPQHRIYVEPCEFFLNHQDSAFYWNDAFEIIHVLNGTCNIDLNDESHQLLSNHVAFISPGQIRRITADSENLTLNRFIIDPTICLERGIDFNQRHFDFKSNRPEISAMLNVIALENQSASERTTTLNGLVQTLFDMLGKYQPMNLTTHSNRYSKQEIVKQGIEYMHHHYAEELSLDRLCHALGISKFYYCRLFKDATHLTINTYLNEIRCHYAHEMIRETTFRIGDIAKKCGYNSTSYFTKTFKELFGYSPSKVKRM